MTPRILPYLLSLPIPPEGPAREHLKTLRALSASGCAVPTGLIAHCWTEATGGNRGAALKYLRGARPWPSPGRKRGRLIRAVEEWEARVAQLQAANAGRNALSCDIDCDDPLPGTW